MRSIWVDEQTESRSESCHVTSSKNPSPRAWIFSSFHLLFYILSIWICLLYFTVVRSQNITRAENFLHSRLFSKLHFINYLFIDYNVLTLKTTYDTITKNEYVTGGQYPRRVEARKQLLADRMLDKVSSELGYYKCNS